MNRYTYIDNSEKLPLRVKVMRELGHGIQNAKSGKAIAGRLYLEDDRKVRLIIEELISEGIPIASSVDSHGGYFICQNEDEAHEYIRVLNNRAKEIQIRIRMFQKACEKKGFSIPEQPALL